MLKARVDLLTENHGSIISLVPQSDQGREWLADNVQGGTEDCILCEPRMGIDILEGALHAGLVLQDARTARIIGQR